MIMPTWFRCSECGAEYYTAATINSSEEESCAECKAILELYYSKDDFEKHRYKSSAGDKID